MKVTNNSKAPQGVQSNGRAVYIQPGETKDIELKGVELERAKRLKFLDIDGKAAKEDDGLDREDLKKQAAELEIDYPKNISTEKLKELIDAKLAS